MSFSDDLRDTFPAPERDAAIVAAEVAEQQWSMVETYQAMDDINLMLAWRAVNYEIERRLRAPSKPASTPGNVRA